MSMWLHTAANPYSEIQCEPNWVADPIKRLCEPSTLILIWSRFWLQTLDEKSSCWSWSFKEKRGTSFISQCVLFTCFEGQLIRLLADIIIQSPHFHSSNHHAVGQNRSNEMKLCNIHSVRLMCVSRSHSGKYPHLFSIVPVFSTSFFPFLVFFSGAHSWKKHRKRKK